MLKRRDFLQLSAVGLVAALASRSAIAQGSYPDRPIKLVVPRAAGGVVDIIAREWSGKVKGLGTVYIENMGGAGGVIGATSVARAPADALGLPETLASELDAEAREALLGTFRPRLFRERLIDRTRLGEGREIGHGPREAVLRAGLDDGRDLPALAGHRDG